MEYNENGYVDDEYANNTYGSHYDNESTPSVKDYLKWNVYCLLAAILGCGIGGFILTIVWACSNANIARRNLMRAQLILGGIFIALYTVLFVFGMIFGTAYINFG